MVRAFAGRPRVFRDPIHGDICFPEGRLQKLMGALSWRVLEQRVKTFGDDKQRYEYVLGSGAADSAEPLEDPAKAVVTQLVNHVKTEHWRTLELAATIDFLEQSEQLSRAEATTKALRLKPLPPLQERAIVTGH